VQFSRQYFQEKNTANGDMRLIYSNGVPLRVVALNTPVEATSYVHHLGFFAQDSWTVASRLTVNLGFRLDRANGWIPEQVSPAGRWVGERRVERQDVYKQWIGVWRLGAVYDVFGTGRTAIKGNASRYGHQVGIGIVTTIHPFTLSTANIAWNDLNRNDFPDPGELGAFEGFTGGANTRYEDGRTGRSGATRTSSRSASSTRRCATCGSGSCTTAVRIGTTWATGTRPCPRRRTRR
jgi:hypothetical protein